MKKEVFSIENMKCNGCATTIRRSLMKLDGVEDVMIYVEEGQVEVAGMQLPNRASLADALVALGYPEQGTGTILQAGMSYVRCMLGKFSSYNQTVDVPIVFSTFWCR